MVLSISSFAVIFSSALGECAKDKDSLRVIQKLDGVRLLWSLLKYPSPKVSQNAAHLSISDYEKSQIFKYGEYFFIGSSRSSLGDQPLYTKL